MISVFKLCHLFLSTHEKVVFVDHFFHNSHDSLSLAPWCHKTELQLNGVAHGSAGNLKNGEIIQNRVRFSEHLSDL